MTNSLLISVAFKQAHFRFGLKASYVQFNFRNIFLSLSLFQIRLVEKISLYFPFNPILLYIVELEQNGSGSATITDNKTLFSDVHSPGPIRLTGKFAFVLFPFYPNQCRLSGGPPLGGLFANNVGFSRLFEAGFE